MPLPFMDGTATITSDVVLTENRHGQPTVTFDLRFDSVKRKDGELVEGDTFEITAKAFGEDAKDIEGYVLQRGDEVMVKGRLKSDITPSAIGRLVTPVLFLDSLGDSVTRKDRV